VDAPDLGAVAALADGRCLLSVGEAGLCLLELETGSELRRFGAGCWVSSLAVLADGRSVLAGSYDGALRLWDIDSGTELRRFVGHQDAVIAVARVADGRWALSSSRDKTLRLWEISTGAELGRFVSDDPITAIAVTPGGNRRFNIFTPFRRATMASEHAIVGDARGRLIAFRLPELQTPL
jgi:WD40 repeat protein